MPARIASHDRGGVSGIVDRATSARNGSAVPRPIEPIGIEPIGIEPIGIEPIGIELIGIEFSGAAFGPDVPPRRASGGTASSSTRAAPACALGLPAVRLTFVATGGGLRRA